MKVIIGFFVFLAIGLLLGFLIKEPTAKIEVKKEIVDLGKVGTGRIYSGTFVLENKGRSRLEVELLKVSCSCAVAEMCKSPINPKNKGTITAYISAPESEGPFGSTIALRTNDPQRPELVLGIQGIAETVMRALPQSLLFGDIPIDMLPKTRTFVVKPGKLATPNMLARLKVDCWNEYFKVETNKTAEEVTVFVTLCKKTPIGALRSSIILCVEELNNYKINVPAIAQVTGNYKISPSSLFYGKVTPGIATMRKCHIKSLDNGDTIEVIGYDLFDKDMLNVNIEYCEGEAIVKAILKTKPKQGTSENVLKLKLTPKNGQQPQYFQIPIIYVMGNSKNPVNETK